MLRLIVSISVTTICKASCVACSRNTLPYAIHGIRFWNHNGMQFSTKDGDHDKYSFATKFHTLLGGTVNAIVLTSMESIFMVHTSHLLIELFHFQGNHYSLIKTEMTIRCSE